MDPSRHFPPARGGGSRVAMLASPSRLMRVSKTVFVFTGVIGAICTQQLYYEGAAHEWSFLANLSFNAGGLLCILLPDEEAGKRPRWWMLGCLGCLDFLGCTLTTLGLHTAGGKVTILVFSSLVGWTALLSRVCLRKVLRPLQATGVMMTMLGLIVGALGHHGEVCFIFKHACAGAGTPSTGGAMLGSIYGILGTLCISAEYTMSEWILCRPSSPSPTAMCWLTGSFSLGFNILYVCIYTIPRWRHVVVQNIHDCDGSIGVIVILFVLLVASSLVHNLAWFTVIKQDGAVRTGMLHSLRAVLAFPASAVVFCRISTDQCYNFPRAIAAAVVLAGNTTFHYGSRRHALDLRSDEALSTEERAFLAAVGPPVCPSESPFPEEGREGVDIGPETVAWYDPRRVDDSI